MKIGIDIMGGDFAPKAALKGIQQVLPELPGNIQLIILGDEAIAKEYLSESQFDHPQLDIIPTTEVIEMGESPTKSFGQKPNSSIAKGFEKLKQESLDVFLSAGNTGAMMVGSLYTIKAIKGVMRPSVTTLVPKINGKYGLLLDVGANADCKQEVLHQFGILGSLYSEYVNQIENPRVALLNIGSEKEKGNLVTQAAYGTMEQSDQINFIGNVEGYDLFKDKADVYVCDGFTGNIVLKSAEAIFELIKNRGIEDEYFKQFDFENHGGTPILGVNKPVIIGHGISTPEAFKNMVIQGKKVVESELIKNIKLAFES